MKGVGNFYGGGFDAFAALDEQERRSSQESKDFSQEESSSGFDSPPLIRKRVTRSSENSAPGTPIGSPKKPATPGSTPKKVKVLEVHLGQWDREVDLTAKQSEILEKGMQAVEELADTPKRKKRSAVAHRVVESAMRKLFDGDVPDPSAPAYHTEAIERLEESSGWVVDVLARSSRIHRQAEHPVDEEFPVVINLNHLTAPANNGAGFHFCPPTHHLRGEIAHVRHNVKTGVWSGFYNGKFSSFFPDCIKSEEQLVQVILNSHFQAQAESRQLRFVAVEGSPGFFIETYVHQEIKRTSAFPIFCAEHWCEDSVYEILPEYRISSQQVLADLRDPRCNKCYESQQHVIFDIAQVLPTAHLIPSGIYFIVPRAAL